MADYAGATASIRERLVANWNVTPITFQNEPVPEPWPPTVADPVAPDFPRPAPWVHLEISSTGSEMRGVGKPGSQVWIYDGLISVHVFVPEGSGDGLARQHAVALGEIFRAKVFYREAPGCYVRTWAPRVDGGGDADHDGNWYRVTMTCPFEYWHRG